MNKTPAQLKKWARATRQLAEAVCVAKAFAQCERDRVNAYVLPIFARYGFTDDMGASPATTRPGRRDGKPDDAPRRVLTSPAQIYLSDDDARVTEYFAEVSRAHVAHGWTGDPEYCPALVAEDLQRKAESALLDAWAEFAGVADPVWTLELREKALEWSLSVCLSEALAGPRTPTAEILERVGVGATR